MNVLSCTLRISELQHLCCYGCTKSESKDLLPSPRVECNHLPAFYMRCVFLFFGLVIYRPCERAWFFSFQSLSLLIRYFA